jgi:hypothetical protein
MRIRSHRGTTFWIKLRPRAKRRTSAASAGKRTGYNEAARALESRFCDRYLCKQVSSAYIVGVMANKANLKLGAIAH